MGAVLPVTTCVGEMEGVVERILMPGSHALLEWDHDPS
jgi:hypothetical protein